MSDWTAGYVADIDYVFGYYDELNPLRANLAFLYAGLVPPQMGTHCELGFGQGLSVNIHAAASATTWYANDFNPAQAAFAQELAQASGAEAHLTDEAFTEFCLRDDLPNFDSIGLHGIWSWISDENRALIVDFIRRKLKVGGALYISYNTQPGWAATIPLRDLLTGHAEVMVAPEQGIVSRIDSALAFAERLMATNPAFARTNPHVAERLDKLKTQNRHYLAHEYFNRDWLPMPFSRLAEWLAPTKLSYACSAYYLDHLNPGLSAEQLALLGEISDTVFQQTVRDFCINQQFRKDYWIKGARRLNAHERLEALRATRVILVQPQAEVKQGAAYAFALNLLADHQARSLGELEQALAGQASFAQILQAVMVLSGVGALQAVQEPAVIARARPLTDKLNAYLLDKARNSSDVNNLASPVTGGGVTVGRFQQLFLLARAQGKATPVEWAVFVWQIMLSQGQCLLKDGQALTTAEANLAELAAQAQNFMEKQLPILQAVQVV